MLLWLLCIEESLQKYSKDAEDRRPKSKVSKCLVAFGWCLSPRVWAEVVVLDYKSINEV